MSIEKYFRKNVLELPSYHLSVQDGIKLNQNESPWDIPVELKAEIIEKLTQTPWNRYPLGDEVELKKKMSKYLGVWPDNLTFANGSNVLIQALVQATSVNGKVMVLDPSFSVYELEGKLLGNKIVRFPLDDDFSLNENEFISTISSEKPNIIFIPNPNAPTGNGFSPRTLRNIIEASSCLVVIDEAYYPFSGFSAIEWVKEYVNLVVLRTFSKAFSLGGLRFGYMISEPDISYQIQKCLLPFCVNKLTYITVDTVLDQIEYVQAYTDKINLERDRVYSELKKLPQIQVYPSNANFIIFKVNQSERIFKELLSKGVILRDVGDGKKLKNILRVSIGTDKENDAFISAMHQVLGG